jgi:hypothetical protein
VRGRVLLFAVLLLFVLAIPGQTHLFFLRGQQGAGPPTLSLTFNPPNPSIPAAAASGTFVTTIVPAWSDGSPFTGSLMFASPNFSDNGCFSINGSLQLITACNLTGDGGTIQNVTVSAIQPLPTLSLTVMPAAPTTPSSNGTSGNVAALQGGWSDGSPFTGSYIFVTPNYDVNGTYALSGSELIINPNGPGVAGAGGTIQHISMEATQLNPTIDGITSTAPTGPPLVNGAGYWSWSARQIGANYVLYLNGQQHSSGDAATLIEVAHGGQLYAQVSGGAWYVWNGTTFVSSGGP